MDPPTSSEAAPITLLSNGMEVTEAREGGTHNHRKPPPSPFSDSGMEVAEEGDGWMEGGMSGLPEADVLS